MKKGKSLIAISLVLILIAGILGACSGTTASGTKENGKGVVNLKFTYWGGPLEKQSIESLINAFNKEHSNIHVTPQQIQGSYIEKMTTMASAHTLPDLGYFQEGSLPQWLKSGAIRDLKPLFDSGEFGDKLKYSVFQFSKDGPIAGSSVANEVSNIYYNKDIFDKAGIPYPPTNAKNAWTWDQFLDVAKKLTVDRNGKHPDDPGFDPKNIKTYGVNNFTYFYETFLFSNNGGIVSPDGKSILIGKQESIDALQKLQDLMYVYHVMPSPSSLSTIPNMDTALLTGRVAMDIDGYWELQELGKAEQDKHLHLGIGVLPKIQKAVTVNSGTPIVVFNNENTKQHWNETKTFLKFIMDPNNSLPLIKGGLWMPNDQKWYTDPALVKKWTDDSIHPKEFKEAVIDWAVNNVVQNPNNYWGDRSDASQIITPGLDEIWSGQKKAADVVNNEILPNLKQKFGNKYTYEQ